jgi:pimeloyl-ACP methyl ester carboxylesterase
MYQAIPVDGFRLAYERIGRGPAVVLLHGWPGDRTDYREVVPLVSPATDVVVPDLRGFGQSDKHRADPAGQYSADAQARSVIGLIDELGLDRPVIGGYDIGSRIAQTVARGRPPASFWLIRLITAMWAHHCAPAENLAGNAFCVAYTSALANVSVVRLPHDRRRAGRPVMMSMG